MQQVNIRKLVDKFSAGTCTEEELAILENWYLQWVPEDYDMDSARLNTIMKSVRQALPVNPKRKAVTLWPRIAAVAAAVALVVFGVYFFNAPSRHLEDKRDLLTSANDIAPGKNGATLTLANGKVIQLSDAKSGVVIGGEELRYSDGEIISDEHSVVLRDAQNDKKSKDDKGGVLSSRVSRDLVASTTRGQTYEFTLPDGTKVWLNASSNLNIPSSFSGTKSRMVKLEGEAYFEVAKNKKRPFIVVSNGQEVTVLGTHFNINSYADEVGVKTTLLEGSVRISLLASSRNAPRNDVVLKPGQQASLKGEALQVKEVDVSEAVAWKDGVFIFDSTRLDLIMRQVARWYDVEIEYENPELKAQLMGGSVSRYDKVSRILKTLENTGAVKFRLEGRTVYVGK